MQSAEQEDPEGPREKKEFLNERLRKGACTRKKKSAKEIEEKDQKKTARPGWRKKGERNVGIIDDKEIEKKGKKR